MARLLLEHGADVNAHSKQGTALMMAVASGNKAMTKLLLAAGADANIGDDTGQTPLSIAAMDELRGSLDIVRALLRAGADPNQLVGGTTLVEMAKGWGLSGAGELLEQAAREQSLGD